MPAYLYRCAACGHVRRVDPEPPPPPRDPGGSYWDEGGDPEPACTNIDCVRGAPHVPPTIPEVWPRLLFVTFDHVIWPWDGKPPGAA